MDHPTTKYALLFRAYAVEFAIAGLLSAVALLVAGPQTVHDFLKHTADAWIRAIFVPAFAAVLAFLWTYYNKADGKFALWLSDQAAFEVYLYAFAATAMYIVAAMIALELVGFANSVLLSAVSLYLAILGFISAVTFVRTVIDLAMLCIQFYRQERSKPPD